MLPAFLEFREILEKDLGALDIRILEIEAAVASDWCTLASTGSRTLVICDTVRHRRLRRVVHQVAVVAHGDAGRAGVGPEIAGGRNAAGSWPS